MRLSAFIRANLDTLVQEWEAYASTQLPAAQGLDSTELQDSAVELLNAIADDLDSEQSPAQQKDKSHGLRPGNAPSITSYAQRHSAARLAQGFTVDQVVSEYRALRASVLRHWATQDKSARQDVQDMIRFNESMDQGLVEAMAWYGTRIASARDLLLGVLGHDLRTPLGAVMMSAELLLHDEGLDGASAKAATRIFNSGGRMTKMIEDLLDFTRSRLGTQLPLNASRLELGPMIRQTIEELATVHPTADLRYDCQGDLWGDWDGSRLGQMLSNLVGNAIQHGEAKTPVSVAARGEDEEVVVTVHNEGPPIAPEMIGKIFDPLMRGVVREAERRSHQESLGLGLYISKEIAKAHEGGIDVSSSLRSGTTFTVRLPRKRRRRRPGHTTTR